MLLYIKYTSVKVIEIQGLLRFFHAKNPWRGFHFRWFKSKLNCLSLRSNTWFCGLPLLDGPLLLIPSSYIFFVIVVQTQISGLAYIFAIPFIFNWLWICILHSYFRSPMRSFLSTSLTNFLSFLRDFSIIRALITIFIHLQHYLCLQSCFFHQKKSKFLQCILFSICMIYKSLWYIIGTK